MNANILSALADSGLVVIGSSVLEDSNQPEVAAFPFVSAKAEFLTLGVPRYLTVDAEDPSACQCCCCTGECRPDYEYETTEEFEAAGFYLEGEMDVVVNAWHQAKFWSDDGSDLSVTV